MMDKGFNAHVIFRWYSSFNTARVDHIFDKIKLKYGDLRECTKANNVLGLEPGICVFALQLLLCLFLMVIICIGCHLPEPGCSSACPEGNGCSEALQREANPPRDDQVCTRLLFSSTGRHWSRVALYSEQPEQRCASLHQDALQLDWKALECYSLRRTHFLLLHRSRQDGVIKSCLAK